MLNEKEIELAKSATWFGSGWGYQAAEAPDMAVARSRGQQFYENRFGAWCLRGGREIANEAQADVWQYFRFKTLDDYFECLRHRRALDFAESWYEEREKVNAYQRKYQAKNPKDNLIRDVRVDP